MKQLDAILKSSAMKGLAVNLTAAILVPIAVSALAPLVRPAARSTLKAGIIAYEKMRETAAEFGEMLDDVVAEVQEELQQSREQAARRIESGRQPAPMNRSKRTGTEG